MKEINRKKIIHRDMKPLNILLHNDRVMICDFGLAIDLGAYGYKRYKTCPEDLTGTLGYIEYSRYKCKKKQ